MGELLEIIIPKVAAQWITLAYCLEFEMPRVEIINQQHPNNSEKSGTKVFIH